MALLFDKGIQNVGIWVYHHETPCCVLLDLNVALTFDLYVVGGGILSDFYLFYLDCLECFVPLWNFSLIWRRHHCQKRAAKFDLWSTLMVTEL